MRLCPKCNGTMHSEGRCRPCSAEPPVEATSAGGYQTAPYRGQRIGDFVLLDFVGRGGTGEVWAAEHLPAGDEGEVLTVALKLMRPDVSTTPALRSRFVREAKAHGRLDHPAIPKFYAYGESLGRPYLATELVAGPTLGQVIVDESPMDPFRALEIGHQIASAVAHMHRSGVVHRDLKPENIKLTGERNRAGVRILDLGICKALDDWDDTLSTHGMLGTPRYMAPEQFIDAGVAGPAADQFALGMVLYEMLTGQTPGIDQATTLSPAAPSSRSPHVVPASIDGIVARLLKRAPRDRFSDMEAVESALAAELSVLHRKVGVRAATGLMVRLGGPALVGGLTVAAALLVAPTCQDIGPEHFTARPTTASRSTTTTAAGSQSLAEPGGDTLPDEEEDGRVAPRGPGDPGAAGADPMGADATGSEARREATDNRQRQPASTGGDSPSAATREPEIDPALGPRSAERATMRPQRSDSPSVPPDRRPSARDQPSRDDEPDLERFGGALKERADAFERR